MGSRQRGRLIVGDVVIHDVVTTTGVSEAAKVRHRLASYVELVYFIVVVVVIIIGVSSSWASVNLIKHLNL